MNSFDLRALSGEIELNSRSPLNGTRRHFARSRPKIVPLGKPLPELVIGARPAQSSRRHPATVSLFDGNGD